MYYDDVDQNSDRFYLLAFSNDCRQFIYYCNNLIISGDLLCYSKY